jgi:hypothetical protein
MPAALFVPNDMFFPKTLEFVKRALGVWCIEEKVLFVRKTKENCMFARQILSV